MIIAWILLSGGFYLGHRLVGRKSQDRPERHAPPKADDESQHRAPAIERPTRRRVSLLAQGRKQQLAELRGEPAEDKQPDEEEKEIHHDLTLGGAMVVLVAGGTFVPTLHLLAFPLLAYGAARLVKFTYDAWRKKEPIGMPLLDATVVIGTILYGPWLAAASSLLFSPGARYLIRLTRDQSQARVSALFDRQNHQVWLLRDGVQVQVPLEQICQGDIVVVDAGTVVPVDGVVSAGLARVDQQALTGESRPQDKAPGDSVLAASMVIEGRIEICAERAGADSLAARLVEIISNSSRFTDVARTRGQRIVDATALPTLGLGLATMPFLGVVPGLAVMDAGFGASLRYAGPLSVLNHLHIASEMGVLIKDGRALERLVDIDTVVFDKTGTLTHDRPVLSAITLFGDSQEDDVLSLAAAAEQHQDHPIARAIRAAAAARRLIVPPLEEAAVYPGRGLSVRACGRRITLGSRRLLEAEGITGIPAELSHAQESSTVLVAIDGALAAILELTAAVRHEAMALVNDLHARGHKVVIVSGDAVEPTRQLAVRLGIATFHAEILPEGKSTLIAQLRAEGRKVCFVGDGINDALALRAADVSISLRGAATVATDAASIVMMNSSLANLIGLLDLAAEFDRNMKTNTALTLVPGAILLFGVYFLGFGLIASNIFYNGSVVLGILNSMRPALKLRDFGDPALDGDTSALGTQ